MRSALMVLAGLGYIGAAVSLYVAITEKEPAVVPAVIALLAAGVTMTIFYQILDMLHEIRDRLRRADGSSN